jgi:hypothetical protein
MIEAMPSGLVHLILILAPLILGLSILAHRRLLRLVHAGTEPVVIFRIRRWNSAFIAAGAVFLVREALARSPSGSLAQICGLILAAEFIYVAYAHLRVSMGSGGLLLGMSFSPWRRFSGYEWLEDGCLELRSRSGRRFRIRVPGCVRPQVQEIVDLNILR